MFEHANRVFPVYFEYAFEKIDDITIALPNGWQVSSMPKAIDQDIQALAYKLSVDAASTTLHLHRTLRSDVFMVPQDKYPVLRTFYQIVRSGDDQQVVLQPAATAAQN